jgi:hypothetical protein
MNDTPRTDVEEQKQKLEYDDSRDFEWPRFESVTDFTLCRRLERELAAVEEFLNLGLKHAEKRYHEEQIEGDSVSIASTRAKYLSFRDMCNELARVKEVKL